MGRKPNWPPIPHVHAASGQERVNYRGRQYTLGKAGSLEAKRAYLELLDSLGPPDPPSPGGPPRTPHDAPPTVAELVEVFLADAAGRYDPEGREAHSFLCSLRPLLARFAALPAASFGTVQLEQARDDMVAAKLLRETINRRVARIKTAFRWAEIKGLVPAGIWAGLRALKELPPNDRRVKSSTPRKVVPWIDVARVCRHLPVHARDMLLVLWFTGARPGEMRTLKAGFVVEEGGQLLARLPRHKNAWRGQGRTVVFGPKARRVVEKRLAGLGPDDYVFAHSRGECYNRVGFARVLRFACEAAGVKLLAAQMRHTAKRRITRELGLDAARAALGQKSIMMTDKYAAGIDEKLAGEAAKKCG